MISLQNILKINAISSGATGLALVAFSDFFTTLFEVNISWPFMEVGIFLMAFSVFVYWVAYGALKSKWVKTIVWLDSAWVLASAVAVLFLMGVISTIGIVLILAVAVWVGAMAYLQNSALQRLKSPS